MIGLLVGTIAYRSDPYIIINVRGVGYKVYVDSTTYAKLQTQQADVTLFTYTHVREDVLELYGFLDAADLKMFEYLIGVSGVGCKTAMGVFGIGKRTDIVNAILRADVGFFTTVPRLGKKNAQKIIIELKSRLGSTADLDLSEEGRDTTTVIDALKQFGYSEHEIRKALQSFAGESLDESEQIRRALRFLGKT